jgi:hypothetical protein
LFWRKTVTYISGRVEHYNMSGANLMQGWVALSGSLATIVLILTALGIMPGIVKPEIP